MENNTAKPNIVPIGKPKGVSKYAVMACAIIVLILIMYFVLPIAGGKEWAIKATSALKTNPIAPGFCMKEAGYGFFRNMAIIVPILWVISAICAFVKRNVAAIIFSVNTVFFILFTIFLTKSINKVYEGMVTTKPVAGFIVILVLSAICLIPLFAREKKS